MSRTAGPVLNCDIASASSKLLESRNKCCGLFSSSRTVKRQEGLGSRIRMRDFGGAFEWSFERKSYFVKDGIS